MQLLRTIGPGTVPFEIERLSASRRRLGSAPEGLHDATDPYAQLAAGYRWRGFEEASGPTKMTAARPYPARVPREVDPMPSTMNIPALADRWHCGSLPPRFRELPLAIKAYADLGVR